MTIAQRNHDQEFAADALAFAAFLRYSGEIIGDFRRMFSQGEIAPLLLFHIMNIYEQQFSVNNSLTVSTPSHPTAIARLNRLRLEFKHYAHQNAQELYPVIK